MPANILPHLTNTKSGGKRGSRQLERFSKRQWFGPCKSSSRDNVLKNDHINGVVLKRGFDEGFDVDLTECQKYGWLCHICLNMNRLLFVYYWPLIQIVLTSYSGRSWGWLDTVLHPQIANQVRASQVVLHTPTGVCVLQLTKYRNYRHIFRH